MLMVAAGAVIALWYGLLAALRRLLSAGFWLSLGADLADRKSTRLNSSHVC